MRKKAKKPVKKNKQLDITKVVLLSARVAHEVNRAYCQHLGDESQPGWVQAPDWQQQSAVDGMVSAFRNPEITPAQSHSMWMAQKTSDGWVHGDVKDPEKKTHPCIVPWDQLPAEQRLKDSLFLAVARAMFGR